eukprot:1142629-Pelagomonas_calceolata.AAC.2
MSSGHRQLLPSPKIRTYMYALRSFQAAARELVTRNSGPSALALGPMPSVTAAGTFQLRKCGTAGHITTQKAWNSRSRYNSGSVEQQVPADPDAIVHSSKEACFIAVDLISGHGICDVDVTCTAKASSRAGTPRASWSRCTAATCQLHLVLQNIVAELTHWHCKLQACELHEHEHAHWHEHERKDPRAPSSVSTGTSSGTVSCRRASCTSMGTSTGTSTSTGRSTSTRTLEHPPASAPA